MGQYFYSITRRKPVLLFFYTCALVGLIEISIDYSVFSSYCLTIVSWATIGILLTIFFLMNGNENIQRMRNVNRVLLLYFVTNFFYFFTARFLQQEGAFDYLLSMVIFKGFSNAICYCLYGLSLWTAYR
jgi:hypothetical protein